MTELTLEQVEKRLAEIDEEVRVSEDVAVIEARTTEKKDLLSQRAELIDLTEKRQAILELEAGAKPDKVIEERGKKMEIEEIRASAEYRLAFLKNLQGKPLTESEQRAISSASTSSGSAIPEATSGLLFGKMVKTAPMISEITLLRVAGNVTFSTEGQRDAAVQHTENAAITAATDTLLKVSLAGFEYNKLLYVSKTVQTMAINAFEGWLIDMIGEDIAVGIENAIINGSGNSAPKGILYATTWSTTTNTVIVTGTATVAYSDIVHLIGMLPARYDGNAKFLANKQMVYQCLANIKDTSGRPIFASDPTGEYPFRVFGYPVRVSDKMAAKTLVLGDFKKVVGNLAQDIIVEKDASAGFASNSIAYRGGAIFDCDIALEDAFVKLTTNTL